MCIGIAIVIVAEPGKPLQFFGKEGNSSHDELLSDRCMQDGRKSKLYHKDNTATWLVDVNRFVIMLKEELNDRI